MKILDKNGLKYIDEGKGEIVLFFHGWGLSPYSYKKIIKELSVEYRVIVPFIDSFRNFKKDENKPKGLMDEENNREIIVIGHSAGGIPAVNFSSDFSDAIKALILIDSVGAIKSSSLVESMIKWFNHGLGIITHPSLLYGVLVKDFFVHMLKPIKLLKEGEFALNKNLEFKPKFPVLILWGEQDDLIPIKNGYNLQKLIQGSKFMSVNGNHYWFLNKPELFVQEVKGFIN